MTLLAIDAGNSRVKWGVADQDGWRTRGWRDTRDCAALAHEFEKLPPPEKILISNVAGSGVRETLTKAVIPLNVVPEWFTGKARQCGVRNSYAEPAQLGPDRWAALIAAWKMFGCNCVVVNAGTTVTVDALASDDIEHSGVFLGGCIVPGLDLMRESLDRGTAQLRQRPGAFYYFPDKTEDAIASGAINAVAGAVERMAGYMQEAGHGTPLVALSGGAAALLKPRLHLRVELVDNLVLEGLRQIANDA